MKKKYCITQIGYLPGKAFEFDKPILVKVIPSDFVSYYYNEKSNPDYKETVMDAERLLLFNCYPGKEGWLSKKEYESDNGKFWEIDMEDFTPHRVTENDPETGDTYLRTMYVVNMLNSKMDVVEAKEKGINCNVESGSQRILRQLDLPSIGEGEDKYYMITQEDNKIYAIPYNNPERDEAGNFHVDCLICLRDSSVENRWAVIQIKKDVGIFVYGVRKFFKFAE